MTEWLKLNTGRVWHVVIKRGTYRTMCGTYIGGSYTVRDDGPGRVCKLCQKSVAKWGSGAIRVRHGDIVRPLWLSPDELFWVENSRGVMYRLRDGAYSGCIIVPRGVLEIIETDVPHDAAFKKYGEKSHRATDFGVNGHTIGVRLRTNSRRRKNRKRMNAK